MERLPDGRCSMPFLDGLSGAVPLHAEQQISAGGEGTIGFVRTAGDVQCAVSNLAMRNFLLVWTLGVCQKGKAL